MGRRRKQKSIAALKNEAAALLQRLRRMEEADDEGYCTCVTSGKILHWKEMDGGHFHSRGLSGTLLDERNIHPQSKGDNCWRMKTTEGVLAYQRFLIEKYGQEVYDELEEQSRQVVKWDRIELEDKIQEYKDRIKIEAERIGE